MNLKLNDNLFSLYQKRNQGKVFIKSDFPVRKELVKAKREPDTHHKKTLQNRNF